MCFARRPATARNNLYARGVPSRCPAGIQGTVGLTTRFCLHFTKSYDPTTALHPVDTMLSKCARLAFASEPVAPQPGGGLHSRS